VKMPIHQYACHASMEHIFHHSFIVFNAQHNVLLVHQIFYANLAILINIYRMDSAYLAKKIAKFVQTIHAPYATEDLSYFQVINALAVQSNVLDAILRISMSALHVMMGINYKMEHVFLVLKTVVNVSIITA